MPGNGVTERADQVGWLFEGVAQFAQGGALVIEGGVSVYGHGHLDVAVPDDAADDLRRDTEVEQERHAGVAKVVKAHLA